MGFIVDSILLELLFGALLLFWLFYTYMTSHYSYWKERNIAYVKSSFPFGTDKNLFLLKESFGKHYQSVYTKFRNEKLVGMFQMRNPYLLIIDAQLVKQIMTKDFSHFVDRGLFDPEDLTPLTTDLFSMRGEAWKTMRHKLSPAFTSGRMKMMFLLMEACSNQFVEAMEPMAERNEKFEVKKFIACFTTDVIASCAFGLESNSIKNPDNEFRINGNNHFEETLKSFMIVNLIKSMTSPWVAKMLHLHKLLLNNAVGFFMKLVGDTVAYREKNNVVRNDFIDILIKIKNNKSEHDDGSNDNNISDQKELSNGEPGLTLEEMTAQAILFFAAGFETTASTLTFCLYEISVNPEVQTKMRNEIDEVLTKHNGKASYQELLDMNYTEAAINETLRRYSSVPILNRQCTEDYKLPDSKFVISKGMKIIIPVYAIHHDPEYYPDPYKFDPERFTDNKIKTRNNYSYMPFGDGPRICIGNRFAMMQMKMCLSMLLHRYELAITEDTPIPLTIDKKSFFTNSASPIILKISKRRD